MPFILQYSLDELRRDTDSLFDLVLCDPQFNGLLPSLSHSSAVQAVAEGMRVLHSAPAPQVQWAVTQRIWLASAHSYNFQCYREILSIKIRLKTILNHSMPHIHTHFDCRTEPLNCQQRVAW